LVHTPAWLTLLWGALISPVAEELLFRGALWSLVNRLMPRAPQLAAPTSLTLPEGVLQTSWLEKAARGLWEHLRSGGVATIVTAATFAYLHTDTPGGLGIVRTISALGLGLCTGLLRHKTGGLAAPLLLHIIFNTASVATARRWVVTDTLPLKYGVPTLLVLLGGVSLLIAVVVAIATRRRNAESA
jgi:membrane protease YdiL (CAAX protease family)